MTPGPSVMWLRESVACFVSDILHSEELDNIWAPSLYLSSIWARCSLTTQQELLFKEKELLFSADPF